MLIYSKNYNMVETMKRPPPMKELKNGQERLSDDENKK
jgi:hypothetical protein